MMKNPLKLLVMVVAIVLILSSVGIPVGAQEGFEGGTTTTGEGQTLQGAGTNAAVPGGPGFVMVHPTAFIPVNSSLEYGFASGGFLYNPGSIGSFYEAAVNLPHGAKITKLVLYYYDNSTQNMSLVLVGMGMDDSNLLFLADLTTSGAEENYRVVEDTTITSETINNQSYAYWIEVGIPASQGVNLMIRGIRIDYSYPVNLPLINR
ncbi:MAG TPA: hypothetical protein PKY64_01700 [Anaerolineaceae bacterium]|nr:hypothetical protein [Anaerolineaceae bacterium]